MTETRTEANGLRSLRPLALLAAGRTGADIERLVREVRRRASRAGRPLAWNDLEEALRDRAGEVSDDLRWRMAVHEAGHAVAYIYDTTDDILDALQTGDLDILYNVPLSALLVAGDPPEGMEIVVPQDYVLAVPWSVFVPKGAANPRGGRSLLHSLLAPQNRIAFSSVGFEAPDGLQGLESIQKIELGPELLVFRDMIKRSKFLDAWFQAVVD